MENTTNGLCQLMDSSGPADWEMHYPEVHALAKRNSKLEREREEGQRLVGANGALVSTVELDPFGGDTYRSVNTLIQPLHFMTYERDTVGGMDEPAQIHPHRN